MEQPRRREPALVRRELEPAERGVVRVQERERGEQTERGGRADMRHEGAHAPPAFGSSGDRDPPQEQRDKEAQAQLEAKLMEKLARADIIAEQRHSIAEELQRMRKDIAQQEAWVKARPQPMHISP